MGPFPPSFINLYILLVVDYVSKWVEAIPTRTNDAKVVAQFLRSHIFSRFGTPRALIIYNGTYFCNKMIDKSCTSMECDIAHPSHTTHRQMGK